MTVYFISDLHLGHKKIHLFNEGKYRFRADTPEKHDEILISRINSVVGKRDKLFILGDVVFGRSNFDLLGEINGLKHIILGNHDVEYFNAYDYQKYVHKVSGIEKYKRYWLTHCPIHPAELRGKNNIHGHVHSNSVMTYEDCDEWDMRYINVCVEAIDGFPVSYDEIASGEYWRIKGV